jgi:3-hydroxy-9,10-secoandrosta-1,3,5(10)-triene-9,17-dione monooxygenase
MSNNSGDYSAASAGGLKPPPSRQNLSDAAKSLAPKIRERAAEADQSRQLPKSTWKDLLESGPLRAYQPAHWGGGEVHPREFSSAIVEVARAEACAGWVAGIVGVHPWQTALYSRQAQEEVWGENAETMSSSSYAPTGKAAKEAGGYRLSGRWSFSSGCDHCAWVNLGAVAGVITMEGRELPDFRSFLLPRKDYRIDDNWFVAGLAGSGSKDIVVEDAFVPEYRSQSHWDYTFGRPLPGWELNTAALYRLPWAAVFINAVVACVLGAAAGFLDTWTELGRTRKGGFGLKVSEDAFMQKLLAESKYTIDTAIMRLYSDCDEMMDAARAGEPFSLRRRAELRYRSTHSAFLASRQIDLLYEAGGGHAVFLNHPLQRRYRDIKAMMSHAGINQDAPARLHGAAEFGLPILDIFL